MGLLTVSSFFKYFIYSPDSDLLYPKEKEISQFASNFFSLLTFNLLPRFFEYFWSGKSIWNDVEKTEIKNRIRTAIKQNFSNFKEFSSFKENAYADRAATCHKIIDNIFLGNATSFVEATYLKFLTTDQFGRPFVKATNNPLKFQKIFSFCPMAHLRIDYPDFVFSPEDSFKRHKIQWFYPGKALADHADAWLPFAHDCTFPNDPDSAIEIHPITGMPPQQFEALYHKKRTKMKDVAESEWFEPLFTELDDALYNNKKTLVHCHAGISRSATFLAAYLVKRFNVTADEAHKFLQAKRPCVNSGFLEQLKIYTSKLPANSS